MPIYTVPETNSSPLKNDSWKISSSLWDGTFSGRTVPLPRFRWFLGLVSGPTHRGFEALASRDAK